MATTVTAAPSRAATLNHTIGIEPMPGDRLTMPMAWMRTARTAVVERYNGAIINVITTDNDPDRRQPLDTVAAMAAHLYAAAVAAPVWPVCDWCGQPDNTCPDLDGHLRLAAQSETGWRR